MISFFLVAPLTVDSVEPDVSVDIVDKVEPADEVRFDALVADDVISTLIVDDSVLIDSGVDFVDPGVRVDETVPADGDSFDVPVSDVPVEESVPTVFEVDSVLNVDALESGVIVEEIVPADVV